MQSLATFSQLNSKSANLSVRDVFYQQLSSIRGLTHEKALKIISMFPTAMSLFSFYKDHVSNEQDRLDYFKDWTIASSRRRRPSSSVAAATAFGGALSARIYRLFASPPSPGRLKEPYPDAAEGRSGGEMGKSQPPADGQESRDDALCASQPVLQKTNGSEISINDATP